MEETHSGIISSQLKLLFLNAEFHKIQVSVLGNTKFQVNILLLKACSQIVWTLFHNIRVFHSQVNALKKA
jgi:hypothetical protein